MRWRGGDDRFFSPVLVLFISWSKLSWIDVDRERFADLTLVVLVYVCGSLDITELDLPTNIKTIFPDPADILNFELTIDPDEGESRFLLVVSWC